MNAAAFIVNLMSLDLPSVRIFIQKIIQNTGINAIWQLYSTVLFSRDRLSNSNRSNKKYHVRHFLHYHGYRSRNCIRTKRCNPILLAMRCQLNQNVHNNWNLSKSPFERLSTQFDLTANVNARATIFRHVDFNCFIWYRRMRQYIGNFEYLTMAFSWDLLVVFIAFKDIGHDWDDAVVCDVYSFMQAF
jgi:hypothetical protein